MYDCSVAETEMFWEAMSIPWLMMSLTSASADHWQYFDWFRRINVPLPFHEDGFQLPAYNLKGEKVIENGYISTTRFEMVVSSRDGVARHVSWFGSKHFIYSIIQGIGDGGKFQQFDKICSGFWARSSGESFHIRYHLAVVVDFLTFSKWLPFSVCGKICYCWKWYRKLNMPVT